MELKDYLNILNRRKWVIIITIVAALAAVFVGTRLQTPIYESFVTLRAAASSTGELSYSSTTYITQLLNTTAQIATSGPVLSELVTRLNLSKEPVVTSEVIPNTELIKITVEDTNPERAALEATTLGDIIISQSNFVYTGGASNAEVVLGTQVAQVEKDILKTREQYAAALLLTPPAPDQADLLYQELLLQQRNYDSLLSQYQQAQYQNFMRSNMITVVEKPLIPLTPSKPQLVLNMILGLVVGLMGGVGLAFVVNSLDATLYSTPEIEHYSGLAAFSRIPKVKSSNTNLFISSSSGSAFADSFRELAMKVQQINNKTPMKVLLIFSAEPNQGKSMIISHLAVSLSEFGKKVVVVDCDLRLPKIHKWFNLPNTKGLKDVIEDDLDLSSALQESEFDGVWVLTSGEGVHKPTILLGSQKMKKLIATLAHKFDYVLLDTPALLAVGDAAVISESADGLILVARRKETSREAAKSAGVFLKNYPDKFTALVVNQDSTSDGYYYHRSEPEDVGLPSEFILKRLKSQQKKEVWEESDPIHKLRFREVDAEVEEAVVAMALEQPLFGQIRVAKELRKKSINITAGAVRSIWLKNGLETFEKRNQALLMKTTDGQSSLSDEQMQAIEKAKANDAAEKEIDSIYPGYLGVQDSIFVGRIEGVGRVYQHTFIDTYTGFAFAKLSYKKDVGTAIDLLKDDVLPFYEKENIILQRILTDRNRIYFGPVDEHLYEQFLSVNHIEHHYTDGWHPKTNGISIRFQKIVHDDFYQGMLRKKTYSSVEELQGDLENWLKKFNFEREYPGKYCYSRTPYQTIQAMKQLAQSDVI